MEDFSQYKKRENPFSLRDLARMSLEALADLASEDRPDPFHSAVARFFAGLYSLNELFNKQAIPERQRLDIITIGSPPRRLFELLNDFGRIINALSRSEMTAKNLRSAFEENGFPYRPNELFSLLEQVQQLDELENAPKPGPEWATRADVRKRYFDVWAHHQKPGNAGQSAVQIGNATQVHKDMVLRILDETRPPNTNEIAEHRKQEKKR